MHMNSLSEIFEESSEMTTARNDSQNSAIPKKRYITKNFNESLSGASTSTPFKKQRKVLNSEENISPSTSYNSDVLQELKVINDRLLKIEANMVEQNEFRAQNKMLREVKVTVQNIQQSVGRMTGELRDDELDDIAKTLPFDSLSAVLDVEENLKNPDYAQAMTTYCHKLKGASEDIGSVMRKIFTDEVLELFNWDGRWEKRALAKLYLVDKILRGVFILQGNLQYEKDVKRVIELSHHRLKQKKYQIKKLKSIQ